MSRFIKDYLFIFKFNETYNDLNVYHKNEFKLYFKFIKISKTKF